MAFLILLYKLYLLRTTGILLFLGLLLIKIVAQLRLFLYSLLLHSIKALINILLVVKLQKRPFINPLTSAYYILELTNYSSSYSRRILHSCYSIGCFLYYSKRRLYYWAFWGILSWCGNLIYILLLRAISILYF